MSKLVSSLKTIIWILFACCYVFFSLCYLIFRIDLGKTGSLVSWFVSFFSTQNHSGKGLQLPLVQGLPTSTPECETDVIVWVPFVTPNHGGNYEEESSVMFTVFQNCSLQSCDIERDFVFHVIVLSFLIVTVVFLQHMLHLVKNQHFWESY